MGTYLVLWTVLLSLVANRGNATDATPTQIQPLPASEAKKDGVGQHVITLSPINTAVVAGGRTSFSCISDSSDTLTWFQIDVEAGKDNVIVSGCALNPDYANKFELENIGLGRCDLVVKIASLNDAMLYRCMQNGGFDPHQSALLAVLDAEPHCSIDNLNPHINASVTLTCDVSYTDNISPMIMTWTDEQGHPVPSSNGTSSAGRTTSSLTFKVTSWTLPQFTCTTNFSALPPGLPSTATNAPQLSFNWISPALEVTDDWNLITPLNTAVMEGQNVTLSSRLRVPEVDWSYVPVNEVQPRTIARRCQVLDVLVDKYKVDTRNGACHLIINKLELSDAGTYTCLDFTTNELAASAELIVLGPPISTTTLVDNVPSIDQVRLTCSFPYSGNIMPVVKWNDETGAAHPPTTDTSRTQVVSRITVTPNHVQQLFRYTIFFKQPTAESSGDLIRATNTPSYTDVQNITVKPAPQDCWDMAYDYPSASSGVYSIVIRSIRLRMEVYCDMVTDGGGWTVFQRRQDGTVDFVNDWDTYAIGFGWLNGEFWLGNNNLAELTRQKRYVLRIDLMNWSDAKRFAEYDSFRVLRAADKYKLDSLGKYSGNAGDSMRSHHLGMMFSTYDNDNDLSDRNCPVASRGAWWYNNCHDSNLNGWYNTVLDGQGVNWRYWTGSTYSLKTTEMKIRPYRSTGSFLGRNSLQAVAFMLILLGVMKLASRDFNAVGI